MNLLKGTNMKQVEILDEMEAAFAQMKRYADVDKAKYKAAAEKYDLLWKEYQRKYHIRY